MAGNKFVLEIRQVLDFNSLVVSNSLMQEVMNLYDMFYTRYLLHKRAYYHKTVNAIELMYVCMAI